MGNFGGCIVAVLAMASSCVSGASAQGAGTPCPWQQADPSDEIGASRTQTPAKALEAVRLVRTGQVYGLAHPYDEETIPTPFNRSLDVFVGHFDQPGPSQSFHLGLVSGDLGQLGTQFDGLGHAGHDLGFYNCLSQAEVGPDDAGRLKKLGVEAVRPFFTRGVLLDFVNHSDVPKVMAGGRPIVEDSYLITVDDVLEVLRSQGVDEPGEGDVVLFRTGWDALYGVDNARFADSPGPGIAVADWLAARRVALVGADTMSVEALDDLISVELVADPGLFGEEIGAMFNAVHFILLTENGIHLLELMRLGPLADDLLEAFLGGRDPFGRGFRRGRGSPYEFLFSYAPVPFTGLPGSPGQPLAIR